MVEGSYLLEKPGNWPAWSIASLASYLGDGEFCGITAEKN